MKEEDFLRYSTPELLEYKDIGLLKGGPEEPGSGEDPEHPPI